MRRSLAIALLAASVFFVPGVRPAKAQAPSKEVQQQLIALDNQWGEAKTAADVSKLLADKMLALGPKGEAQGKADQIAASTASPSSGYVADEHKFEMLTPDVVVMTHRGTATTMENGKPVKDSHRSLHVFQRINGKWQVVASAQAPIQP